MTSHKEHIKNIQEQRSSHSAAMASGLILGNVKGPTKTPFYMKGRLGKIIKIIYAVIGLVIGVYIILVIFASHPFVVNI